MLIGVVGKPNTGKSTFFKASTLAEVEIENRPFVTIKPNRGTGFVKVNCVDKEFGVNCNPRTGYCINGSRFVPIDLLDVAGLIPGAHEGLGLGNAFLDDLRQADLLIHIIDISGSTNENGGVVDPLSYDPLNDVILLEKEIDLWFFGILNKEWSKFIKQAQLQKQDIDKAIAKQFSGLKVNENIVKEAFKKLNIKKEQYLLWDQKDLKNLCIELRKLSKPIVIAANKIDIPGSEQNLERLKQRFSNYLIVPCSAESELALKEAAKHKLINYIPGENNFEISGELSEEQKKALQFIKEKVLNKYESTGIQQVLDKSVFELLKKIVVFPVENANKLSDKNDNILPDAYIFDKDSSALDLAFNVHSDFGNNFIKAVDVKKKMVVGKDHKLKNRDVIEIVCSK